MRFVRNALGVVVIAATISVPALAGAAGPRNRTTAIDITATCETLPRLPDAPGPVVRRFHLEVSTPRHVSRRGTATVSAQVNYQVSGFPEVVGGIAVQATQSGATSLYFI